MTQVSRPWSGISVGDAGPYSADQWATLWRYTHPNSADPDAGPVFGSGTPPDSGLIVSQRGAGANMSVDVSPGRALVDGTFYESDAVVNNVIAANASGNPRIDTIILRKDWSLQTVRQAVLQGTPAATPAPPGLSQSAGTMWEIPIGDVAVANGAVSITNANITPRQHPANAADGVYLQNVLNNSGGDLQTGDVVVWDTTTDRAVTTSTTVAAQVAGVWIGRTPNAGYGRVLVKGIGYVNCNGAVTKGQALVASGTAKQSKPVTVSATQSGYAAFAYVMVGSTGSGLVLAMVDALVPNLKLAYDYAYGTGYTTVSNVFADINAALNFTLTVYSGRVACWLMLAHTNTNTTTMNIAISVDGVDQASMVCAASGANNNVSTQYHATGLAPGSTHTFKARWLTAAGTATAQGVSFQVQELP